MKSNYQIKKYKCKMILIPIIYPKRDKNKTRMPSTTKVRLQIKILKTILALIIMCSIILKSWQNPIYCSWSTNNHPPLIFDFLFLCFFRLCKGQVCPAGLERGLVRAPQGQSPPQGLALEIKTTPPPYFEKKIKNKAGGGVIGAPSAKQGIAPVWDLEHI